MSALDNASLLEQLIISGELAIQMRSTRPAETIAELVEAIENAFDRPADDVRTIDYDTVIFAMSLSAATLAMHRHDRTDAAKYLRVIGVLLPEIRSSLSVAIEQRKRPSA